MASPNERIYAAYKASELTRDEFFEVLHNQCVDFEIEISRSSFDSWMKSAGSKSSRLAPAHVAHQAELI